MPVYYNDESEICREFPIGFIAVEIKTGKPYTGGRYTSGAKVFKTRGLAVGAITQHLYATNYPDEVYEYYEVYYKKPL